jgi:LmbE family N-acetylglucosaminyl deacetylase
MRWVYLSPHFDDAVLSCGGLIWEQARAGVEVEIWTILAGDPPPGPLSDFATVNHKLWGVETGEEVVSMRKLEDEAAATIVQADLVHFGIPDAIYRRSPGGEYLYTQTVMTPPRAEDDGLPQTIAEALRSELQAGDRLICPLALGGHVDHIQVRRAAESLDLPLWYYADVPYLLSYPAALPEAISTFVSQRFDISEAGLGAWLEGVAAYRSQVDSLYKDDKNMLFQAIRDYCQSEGGLRLWHLP